MLGEEKINEIKELLLKVVDKQEELLLVANEKSNYRHETNLTYIKNCISKIQTEEELKAYVNSHQYKIISEQVKLCGNVCCKYVYPYPSFTREYACNLCPFLKFEEMYL